nr:sulfatase [Phenylobacterium sp.]
MSRKIWLGVGLALLVAIGLGLANYKSIILFVVGNLGKQEIAENQEIAWARGPDAAPEGDRPPNVIVILADDLGMNDI